jgi:hypothetical protein
MSQEAFTSVPLGQVVITAALRDVLLDKYELLLGTQGWPTQLAEETKEMFLHEAISDILELHASGRWGDVCPEDAQANERALLDGDRVLSSYKVLGIKVWVITEWDRSYTTVLRPSDY